MRAYDGRVQQVFVSSIQRDFGDVRQAARGAIESLGMHPLMAETAGAHPTSPQRALLDFVARCDFFLLLVGPRYSEPTEDELKEAFRLSKTVLVLRQEGDLEDEQQAFLGRVAGGWSGGKLWGTFAGAADAALAVVRALTNAAAGSAQEDLLPAAQARAGELSGDVGGGRQTGSLARIAMVPAVRGVLLDAVALDRPDLGDQVAGLVRARGLVPQSVGIRSSVSRGGVAVAPVGQYANTPPIAFVGSDGAVVCEFSVAGDDKFFGSSRIVPDRLRDGIVAAGTLALDVWSGIDEREEVQQVAVSVAIPEAQHKVFGVGSNSSSISMGSGLPQLVVVPSPAVVVRRGEVASDGLAARLVAEVKRVFADARAVDQ